MDEAIFDRWTRMLSACLPRRGLAVLVTGSGACAGFALTLDATAVDAKKKKKKKKEETRVHAGLFRQELRRRRL
jgi:hypothetical protein